MNNGTNSTNREKKLSSFDTFIYFVKMFFCWNVEIKYPDLYSYISYMNSSPNIQLCWVPYEIPILQYSICLIQTVIAFYPNTVWGPDGVFLFNTIVLIFLLTFLGIRFAWVTEEHREITECDSIIIQTVVYVITIEYVYHELLRQ